MQIFSTILCFLIDLICEQANQINGLYFYYYVICSLYQINIIAKDTFILTSAALEFVWNTFH